MPCLTRFLPRSVPYLMLATLGGLATPARAGLQSAFAPRGNDAAQILELTWVMTAGGAVIFAGVMLLLALALFGGATLRAKIGNRAWIVGGGIVLPVVVLSALLVYTLMTTSAMVQADEPPAARVEVTGELWWWRVRYLDEGDNLLFETANELRIPVGRPVELILRSDNVIHSFWVPSLAGKIDMIPGSVNRKIMQATEPGVFRGQCAEYCGAQHAKMAFFVVSLPPEDYEAWVAVQMKPVVPPRQTVLEAGKQLFMESRCAICHTIRGTEAHGRLGPDLTHVGGRLSIAAGILPNNQGAIAGWITNSHDIKPGNKMPTYKRFSGEELRALSAYLESLR